VEARLKKGSTIKRNESSLPVLCNTHLPMYFGCHLQKRIKA
jgi:hypothetical protein